MKTTNEMMAEMYLNSKDYKDALQFKYYEGDRWADIDTKLSEIE